MDYDEMSSRFCEGLFVTPREQLIVRRLLENVEELKIIDELLSDPDAGEQSE
jgi:hypothetical protein